MSRSWGTHSSGVQTSSQAQRHGARTPAIQPGVEPRTFAGPSVVSPGRHSWSANRGQVRITQYCTDLEQQLWEHASASRPGDSHSWGSGGPGTFGFPVAGGYAPGHGVSFRPFIAYDAVEPFDTSLSLDKRRAWRDKFQYTASSGGWREQELCTRLYSRLSHNPGTKAWVQPLSDRFYKEFCRSTESPVERYLGLKQEPRETPQTFLWRLNAAATKANLDFHSAFGYRRHVNQFLKNLRDRELQLSLQGRVLGATSHKAGITTRGGGGTYAAVANPEVPEPQAPDTEGLRWEDEDDSGYGYQYDEENDEAYDGLVDQEEIFRAEAPGSWNERNGCSHNRHDPRGGGPPGASRPSVPCPVCNKLGHTRERCWQLMKCDRCGGKHPTNQCRRRECEACCQLNPAGECAVIKAFKEAAQRGLLQGLAEEVLQRLHPEVTPALNN
ncbi:LOW QUALITY PROTEIN: hypothetical protein PHMEG_00028662 [Phytophthora megakarya]|uniref:Retrotransposon gag domain-containing protein n=1 Tax=Phytophthora megakarya TaxID=4795 RepID=A0A225V4F2_9STRA|nr:LOW QUALITY PROTEIN: hypothetical protein PHMEG_00028662 [Phytophthora megakarya]